MSLTAFVRKTPTGRYSATMVQPISLAAEGSSRDEALAQLKKMANDELSRGEIVEFEFASANPWLKFSGIWKENEEFDAYLSDVEEYRQSANLKDPS